jgi:hypothetical protein
MLLTAWAGVYSAPRNNALMRFSLLLKIFSLCAAISFRICINEIVLQVVAQSTHAQGLSLPGQYFDLNQLGLFVIAAPLRF